MKETEEILQKLGENIRRIRKEKRLSLVDVTVTSGIDVGDISRIERGQINITFAKLVKLAAALEVDLNAIYPMEQ